MRKLTGIALAAHLAIAPAHDPHIERRELQLERRERVKERDLDRKQKRTDKRRNFY